jgi:hypothetical protein
MLSLKNQDNGFNISRLGLGCMRMSMSDGTENRKESTATIHAALAFMTIEGRSTVHFYVFQRVQIPPAFGSSPFLIWNPSHIPE